MAEDISFDILPTVRTASLRIKGWRLNLHKRRQSVLLCLVLVLICILFAVVARKPSYIILPGVLSADLLVSAPDVCISAIGAGVYINASSAEACSTAVACEVSRRLAWDWPHHIKQQCGLKKIASRESKRLLRGSSIAVIGDVFAQSIYRGLVHLMSRRQVDCCNTTNPSLAQHKFADVELRYLPAHQIQQSPQMLRFLSHDKSWWNSNRPKLVLMSAGTAEMVAGCAADLPGHTGFAAQINAALTDLRQVVQYEWPTRRSASLPSLLFVPALPRFVQFMHPGEACRQQMWTSLAQRDEYVLWHSGVLRQDGGSFLLVNVGAVTSLIHDDKTWDDAGVSNETMERIVTQMLVNAIAQKVSPPPWIRPHFTSDAFQSPPPLTPEPESDPLGPPNGPSSAAAQPPSGAAAAPLASQVTVGTPGQPIREERGRPVIRHARDSREVYGPRRPGPKGRPSHEGRHGGGGGKSAATNAFLIAGISVVGVVLLAAGWVKFASAMVENVPPSPVPIVARQYHCRSPPSSLRGHMHRTRF